MILRSLLLSSRMVYVNEQKVKQEWKEGCINNKELLKKGITKRKHIQGGSREMAQKKNTDTKRAGTDLVKPKPRWS